MTRKTIIHYFNLHDIRLIRDIPTGNVILYRNDNAIAHYSSYAAAYREFHFKRHLI